MNIIIILERILLLLLAGSFIAVELNVKDASNYLGIVWMVVSPFYLLLSAFLLKPRDQKHTTKRVLFSIFCGFFFSMAISGPVFRLNHWPGAGGTLLGSIPVMLIITIIAYSNYSRKQDAYFKRVYTRSFPMLLISILFFINPIYYALESFRYRDYPAFVEARKEARENPSDEAFAKVDMESMRMYNSREDFIRQLEERAQYDSLFREFLREEMAKEKINGMQDE